MEPSLVVALIAAVAAPLGAYLLAARRFSGKIESSDAQQLWEESRSIRQWSQDRMSVQDHDIKRLQDRVSTLEDGNDLLIKQNRDLLTEIEGLKVTILGLRDDVSSLTAQLKASKARVVELEDDPNA